MNPSPEQAIATYPLSRLAWLRTLVGLAISLAGLALALRGVHLEDVAVSLGSASLWLVALAAASALTTTVISSLRWRLLLCPHSATLRSLVAIFFVSQLCNAALPGKLGAPLRAALTSRLTGIPLPFALGSVTVERVLDSALIAVLSALLLMVLPVPPVIAGVGRDAALIAVVALLLIVLAAAVKPRLLTPPGRVISGLHLPRQMVGIFDALDVLRQRATYAPLLSLSLLLWLLGMITNDLVLRSLRLDVPWWTAVLLLVALQLGGKLPSSPANIGIFHYIAVLVLQELGVEASAAFSYAFVLHTVIFIVPAVVGALCLWRLSAGGGLLGVIDHGF